MKLISLSIATMVLAFACSSAPKKVEKAEEVAGDTCCCKWVPPVTENNKASFEMANRMECSGRQGDCVDESQCTAPAPTPAQ